MKRVYARCMDTNRHSPDPHNRSDSQIGALLDRIEESTSIVDRLMAMPATAGDGASEAPEWEAAVARRLQDRLAQTMRDMIDGGPERKRA